MKGETMQTLSIVFLALSLMSLGLYVRFVDKEIRKIGEAIIEARDITLDYSKKLESYRKLLRRER